LNIEQGARNIELIGVSHFDFVILTDYFMVNYLSNLCVYYLGLYFHFKLL